jgi:hypothetical protein
MRHIGVHAHDLEVSPVRQLYDQVQSHCLTPRDRRYIYPHKDEQWLAQSCLAAHRRIACCLPLIVQQSSVSCRCSHTATMRRQESSSPSPCSGQCCTHLTYSVLGLVPVVSSQEPYCAYAHRVHDVVVRAVSALHLAMPALRH